MRENQAKRGSKRCHDGLSDVERACGFYEHGLGWIVERMEERIAVFSRVVQSWCCNLGNGSRKIPVYSGRNLPVIPD